MPVWMYSPSGVGGNYLHFNFMNKILEIHENCKSEAVIHVFQVVLQYSYSSCHSLFAGGEVLIIFYPYLVSFSPNFFHTLRELQSAPTFQFMNEFMPPGWCRIITKVKTTPMCEIVTVKPSQHE